ncbi:glycolipid transfer protein [Diabrotica undecimpunctata]|uniref:glycolipid transfer protein n=1 Tax=Diabrotica undecimpunctata TaxID=50387 RepID=UPI003B6349D3
MSEDISGSNDSTVFTVLCVYQNSSDKIKTKEFLEACSDAVSIIERFGKAFAPVVLDMQGNIQKLKREHEKDVTSNMYVEDMILRERSEVGLATEALMWLKRGLHFLSTFFTLILEDSQLEMPSSDFGPLLKKAYTATLKSYHGWLGVQLFNILSRFMPNRKQLMFTLALDKDNHEQIVIRDMKVYTQNFSATIQRLNEFYYSNGLEIRTNT